MPEDGLTVRDLRRRWKPTKEHLVATDAHEDTRIRIHRCMSWMQRVEEIADEASDDSVMVLRWIALNSLYGRWDETACEPVNERLSLGSFFDRVRELDGDARLTDMLETHKRLVMTIFDDNYLTKWFWEDPSDERASRRSSTKRKAQTWYIEKRYAIVLDQLLARLYFMRCQLVHGAATHGGKLNRTALRHCTIMLGHLLPAVLLVIIDHGSTTDWGPLCYPPTN